MSYYQEEGYDGYDDPDYGYLRGESREVEYTTEEYGGEGDEGYEGQRGYADEQGGYGGGYQQGYGAQREGYEPASYEQGSGAYGQQQQQQQQAYQPREQQQQQQQQGYGYGDSAPPGVAGAYAAGQQITPYFEYSRCNGHRKALLIGINYYGSDAELKGCINDVHNVQRFIMERYGYQPGDMVVLTDDNPDPRSLPTKENMLRAMAWLVADAQRDDALFFHYSGHGTQDVDLTGHEEDGYNEAICPVDYRQAGLIIDDDMYVWSSSKKERGKKSGAHVRFNTMVRPLPPGCRLTMIFDSCHSGTVGDLPYCYTEEGTIKEPDYFANATKDLSAMGMGLVRGDTREIFSGLVDMAKGAYRTKEADELSRKTNTAPGDVIALSGCKDSQTSADTQEAGQATGAMSYALIEALSKSPDVTYQQLLQALRDELRGKYSQRPQLTACHPINTELDFVI